MPKESSASARIDDMQREVAEVSKELIIMKASSLKVENLEKSVARLEDKFEKLVEKLENFKTTIQAENKATFVNTDKFEPVKLLVYGMTGIILVAVITALVALVIVP